MSVDELPQDDPERLREERGSLIFMIVALVIIALIGAPCCCYFGAGLFQGVHSLRTGAYTNPARTRRPMRRQHPLRQPSPRPRELPGPRRTPSTPTPGAP